MPRRIAIVVAVAKNNVIGRQNALPWRLPDDLRRFKALTLGKPVVMGRKTFDSIGKPLPGRQNIVLSRQPQFAIDGCTVCASLDDALAVATSAEEICVIGGEAIFRAALPRTERLYLTQVHANVEGDVFFPELSGEWRETHREEHAADDRHAYAFSFVDFERAR
jgi:dihydrofolate reductase